MGERPISDGHVTMYDDNDIWYKIFVFLYYTALFAGVVVAASYAGTTHSTTKDIEHKLNAQQLAFDEFVAEYTAQMVALNATLDEILTAVTLPPVLVRNAHEGGQPLSNAFADYLGIFYETNEIRSCTVGTDTISTPGCLLYTINATVGGA